MVETYNLGSLLQANEEIFGDFRDIGVSRDATGFINGTSTLTLPVDAALDLTLEVAGVLAWEQSHLDIAVRVGFQLTLHRL